MAGAALTRGQAQSRLRAGGRPLRGDAFCDTNQLDRAERGPHG
jgi:hypothetical protein